MVYLYLGNYKLCKTTTLRNKLFSILTKSETIPPIIVIGRREDYEMFSDRKLLLIPNSNSHGFKKTLIQNLAEQIIEINKNIRDSFIIIDEFEDLYDLPEDYKEQVYEVLISLIENSENNHNTILVGSRRLENDRLTHILLTSAYNTNTLIVGEFDDRYISRIVFNEIIPVNKELQYITPVSITREGSMYIAEDPERHLKSQGKNSYEAEQNLIAALTLFYSNWAPPKTNIEDINLRIKKMKKAIKYKEKIQKLDLSLLDKEKIGII